MSSSLSWACFPTQESNMNDSSRRFTVAPSSRRSAAAIFHQPPRVRARHAGRGARKRPPHSWARWSDTARFPNDYIPDRARNTTTRRRSATSDWITHEVTWISNFNITANMHLKCLIDSSHFSTRSLFWQHPSSIYCTWSYTHITLLLLMSENNVLWYTSSI